MTKEATKEKLVKFVDELTAAVFGADPQARPMATICRDLHQIAMSPEGRAAGYQRPYPWLEAWRAYTPINGPSEVEQERRRLADAGLCTSTEDDARRRRMQEKAKEAAREYEAARNARLQREAEDLAHQNTPITRKSLANVLEG